MDNDLDVKHAFDRVDQLVSKIHGSPLRPEEALGAVGVLRDIDSVLGVIF